MSSCLDLQSEDILFTSYHHTLHRLQLNLDRLVYYLTSISANCGPSNYALNVQFKQLTNFKQELAKPKQAMKTINAEPFKPLAQNQKPGSFNLYRIL